MASYGTLRALSEALYNATAEVIRLSGEISKLKAIHKKLKEKSQALFVREEWIID